MSFPTFSATRCFAILALCAAAAWPCLAAAQPADSPPASVKFRHITLFANDNERVAAWYVDMVGFRPDARFELSRPDGTRIGVIRLRLGDMLMHVSRLDGLTNKERGREYQGWRHVAFAVESVDVTWARLKARGADVVGAGGINFVPPGYRVAYARDPEGNFVEFYQDAVQ